MKTHNRFLKEILPLLKIAILCFFVCVCYIIWLVPGGVFSGTSDKDVTFVSGINILININTAPAEELALLPNIGMGRAEDIVAYREEHGAFETIEEIQQVNGIGQATYEKIKDIICV